MEISSKLAHKYAKWHDPEDMKKRLARSDKSRPYSSIAIHFNPLHP